MTPFVLSDEEKKSIADLKAYAEAHSFSLQMCLDMVKPGFNWGNYIVELSIGCHIVFTIEDQPSGKVRHLSISAMLPSTPAEGWPSPDEVQVIMWELGFESDLSECIKRIDSHGPGRPALNILEPVSKSQ